MPSPSSISPDWPLAGMPELAPPLTANNHAPPDLDACHALWDKYHMRANIRDHSRVVGHIAKTIASRAFHLGVEVNVMATWASGLLHDLAKTWCLEHGGSHAFLGASWTLQETGNYAVAQGVILHVHWPWPIPCDNAIFQLPILVLYADKRTMHGKCVPLEERFDDLLIRYGKTEKARRGILESFEQSKNIEKILSQQLGCNLNEDTFDCGRLVQ